MKNNIAFKGRSAVESQRANGVQKILATFIADRHVTLSGRETIYRNGERVGWLSSAGYGHTLNKFIGMGYIRDADGVDITFVKEGVYELEVTTVRVPCSVTLAPLYDPNMKRVKC